MVKIYNIFVMGMVDWSMMGGLLGLMLILVDVVVGVKVVCVDEFVVWEVKGLKLKDRDIDDDFYIYGGRNLVYFLVII